MNGLKEGKKNLGTKKIEELSLTKKVKKIEKNTSASVKVMIEKVRKRSEEFNKR